MPKFMQRMKAERAQREEADRARGREFESSMVGLTREWRTEDRIETGLLAESGWRLESYRLLYLNLCRPNSPVEAIGFAQDIGTRKSSLSILLRQDTPEVRTAVEGLMSRVIAESPPCGPGDPVPTSLPHEFSADVAVGPSK